MHQAPVPADRHRPALPRTPAAAAYAQRWSSSSCSTKANATPTRDVVSDNAPLLREIRNLDLVAADLDLGLEAEPRLDLDMRFGSLSLGNGSGAKAYATRSNRPASPDTSAFDVQAPLADLDMWLASAPSRSRVYGGHSSPLSSCSDDSSVTESVRSGTCSTGSSSPAGSVSRTVSECDDAAPLPSWDALVRLDAAAPAFTPTNYNALPTTAASPFVPHTPAALNPPSATCYASSAVAVAEMRQNPNADICDADADFEPELEMDDSVPVGEDGLELELTHTQIKHALPEWMCAEVCQLKKKKTRRGCRGHRRNRKKREDEVAAGLPNGPASLPALPSLSGSMHAPPGYVLVPLAAASALPGWSAHAYGPVSAAHPYGVAV